MRKRIVFSVVIFAVLLAAPAPPRQSPPVAEIHQLYIEDQQDRGVSGQALHDVGLIQRDAARRKQVHAMIEAGTLTSPQDFHDAAFIYQHGQDPNDYLLAHVLGTVAVAKGDTNSLWISAAALDRYLNSIHQPQVFGTQYQLAGNSPVTQDPYERSLIPDRLRAVYCVPSLEQQQKNLAEFNAGRYPAGILPAGCTR